MYVVIQTAGEHRNRRDLYASTTKDGLRCWTARREDADTFDTILEAEEEYKVRDQDGFHLSGWTVTVMLQSAAY